MPRATTAAWRGHAAAGGDDGLGRVHALDVFGAGLDADEDDGRRLLPARATASAGSNTIWPTAAPGDGRQALDEDVAHGVVGDGGMEQLVELRRIEAQDGFFLA